MEGKNGTSKDEAKAGQILTQLIKGIYLVKFGCADGFNPQTPREYCKRFTRPHFYSLVKIDWVALVFSEQNATTIS